MMLVVGATGELGSMVAKRLVEGGQPVRCLVRPGSDRSALPDGVEQVEGDLTDPASLRRACEGVRTVVTGATAISRRLTGASKQSIREVDDEGMAALVDAAQAAGVERFVYVSYVGVDLGLGMPLERAKVATERRLTASRMRPVIVRPEAFQEIHLGPLGRFDVAAGKVAVFGKGDNPHRWIATDDVAALVAAVAVEPDPPAVVEVGGPEALTRNEAIAVAERATGRSFKVQRVPLAVARVGMRLLARPNDAVASILGTGVLQDTAPLTCDDVPLRERGITPRSATEWIEEQAGVRR
ncbi:MAG TPA: NAD(P)H-binding protein [Nocardioides sp.]|nr:NAD(P)H-binding protein [Nocardioides sp.]